MSKQRAFLGGEGLSRLDSLTHWSVALLAFTDSSGEDWARGSTFLLRGEQGEAAFREIKHTGAVVPEPQLKRVDCEAAN
jgi:hypothetical protein